MTMMSCARCTSLTDEDLEALAAAVHGWMRELRTAGKPLKGEELAAVKAGLKVEIYLANVKPLKGAKVR